ncbi:LysE family translocator [Salinisphaera hydrothermalis]|uniref:LysE family translocator n=1 Tax=Salinisphaera hydrothermalis TaxID=563188 RepID=UPI00334120FC
MSFLALVAGLWLLAAISPGPNFVLVVRNASRHGLGPALWTTAGIATATLVWGLAGALGIRALFIAAPWAYTGLKVIGGAYLIWLGLRLLRPGAGRRAAVDTDRQSAAPSGTAAWATGLGTNLANPKTAVFVSSLFATTMPAHAPVYDTLAAVGLMGAVSAMWYSVVAVALSRPRARRTFERVRHVFDRLVGAVLAGFGLDLVVSNAR